MKSICLPGTDLHVSRFIFGTSGLFNIRGRASREGLLEEAVAQGFTHFDSAPYYGFGQAERGLAATLRRHPDVTVATKVGLYSPGGDNQPAWSVFARKAAGKAIPSLSRPALDFALGRAKKSLDGSLRRLGRARIDLFLLHEPELALVRTDEWLRWLEDCRTDGTVRYFGIAGMSEVTKPLLEAEPGIAEVLQIADSIESREADPIAAVRPMQITYGYVSSALARNPAAPVPEILAATLERNRTGAVIVSTTRRERLAQYGPIAERSAP